jgi:hypothetical protein
MKKLLIPFILLIVFACKKEAKEITQHQWKVKSIRVHPDSSSRISTEDYILSFEDKYSYSFNLSINSCGGEVQFKSKNKVNFDDAACTLACCDSDFSQKSLDILTKSEVFELNDDVLIFKTNNGNQSVNFQKIN